MSYNFKIFHKKEKENRVANTLLRRLDYTKGRKPMHDTVLRITK